jgi:methylglutaconyl-CoA hydratase
VRVVLLRGAGKDFCAGADLAQTAKHAGHLDSAGNLADSSRLGTLFITMRRLTIPVVTAVQGRALGGGAGVALGSDLVLASENAELGYPEVHLGLVPAMVGAILRRQVGEKVAFELLARGERIGAAEARRLGLVNRVFPAKSFDADALAFAQDLATRPRTALSLVKRLLYGVDSLAFEDAIGRGAEINILARMTEAAQERVKRFLEKREE